MIDRNSLLPIDQITSKKSSWSSFTQGLHLQSYAVSSFIRYVTNETHIDSLKKLDQRKNIFGHMYLS